MALTTTLSIDATALARFDFEAYIGDFFDGLGSGENAFYGGDPDTAFGQEFFLNGSQILTRYVEDGAEEPGPEATLLDGADLAYDFIHHGSSFGHGITGSVDSLTFGAWIDGETTGTEGAGEDGRVTDLDAQLLISGFDIVVAPGTGADTATNAVYLLYAALRDKDAGAIYGLLQDYSLDVTGTGGDDSLRGYRGEDALSGGRGADELVGGFGNDGLVGGAGADILRGGVGFDRLFGGTGADTLIDGAGGDALWGGGGEDIFLFTAGSGANNTIRDFDLARDRIDLTAFDLDEVEVIDGGWSANIVIDNVSIRLAGIAAADVTDAAFLL